MPNAIIDELAKEYLRQERINRRNIELMHKRHEEEIDSLIESIQGGPDNPWTAAFRELRIYKTRDLVEQVAERLRKMQQDPDIDICTGMSLE